VESLHTIGGEKPQVPARLMNNNAADKCVNIALNREAVD
jgi:hypothetical protein